MAPPTAMPIWIEVRAYGASRIRSASPGPPRSLDATPAMKAEPGSQPPNIGTWVRNSAGAGSAAAGAEAGAAEAGGGAVGGGGGGVGPVVGGRGGGVLAERVDRGREFGDRHREPVQQDAVRTGHP